ncbi:MAG: carboxypeptidase regulatory-like domain-containing protein [Planctomycetes bacterium]|nr:carboxypeptidase regulatory-like domain-containing protein [Planctomycetota bacterium]
MTRLLLTLALLVAAGCGGESYPLAQVSGTVTLDGKPLPEARVFFEPKRKGENINSGFGSTATTNEQGRFQLTSLGGDSGAVIGEHYVLIRTIRGEEGPNGQVVIVSREKLPSRYHDQSTLIFTVPPDGTEQADFALTSDP